jgi:hypothetical protein
LQDAFDQGFGDATLKSIEFTRLIIPAVNLTKGEPHVFRSRHLPKALHDQHIKLADVAVAATAAPTYFPHRQIDGCDYVDGGMWANDASPSRPLRPKEPSQLTLRTDRSGFLSSSTGDRGARADYPERTPGAPKY